METLTHITNYMLAQSWQIALLVVVIAVLSRLLRSRSAHVRYMLWLIVLAKCLIPPLYTIPLAVLPEQEPVESLPASPMPEQTFTAKFVDRVIVEQPILPVARDPSPVVAKPVEQTLTDKLGDVTGRQWLGLGWIAGAIVFTLAALVKAVRTNSWLRKRRRQLPAKLQNRSDDFFTEAGITNIPKVWLVKGTGQPFVWGLLRGSIYLPANFETAQTAKCRRAVLGHELSHVLRFDAAVNLLQIVAQAVYWFHPLVWWANRKIRAEREKCCDETAIARLNALPTDYSRAIVNTLIAEHKSTLPVPSLAIAGPVKNIEDRIKTIMKSGKKFYRRPTIITIATVLLLAATAVPTTLALTARSARKTDAGVEASQKKGDSELKKLLESLGSEDYRQREKAARKLGDVLAVEPLIAALNDERVEVRRACAGAFQKIRDGRAVKPLLAALNDSDSVVRNWSAYALAKQEDGRAVQPLIALLQNDPDTDVRYAAAQALEKFRDPRSIGPLVEALRDGDWQLKLASMGALWDMEDPRIIEGLIAALNDQNKTVRSFAASELGNYDDRRAVEPLIVALADSEYEVRADAILALKEFKEDHLVDALINKLQDSHPYVVWTAATVLSEWRDPRSIEPLARSIPRLSFHIMNRRPAVEMNISHHRHENPALRALINMGEPAVESLLKTLTIGEGQVDGDVVWALGQIGDTGAVGPLVDVLKNDSWTVRRDAVEALGLIGDPAALPALIAALNDKEHAVREAVAKAIEQIKAGQKADTQLAGTWGEAGEGLQCRLKTHKNTWTKFEDVTLQLDVRNEGDKSYGVWEDLGKHVELEVDGKWHKHRERITEMQIMNGLLPAKLLQNQKIRLDDYQLKLPTERGSKYKIRARFTAVPQDASRWEGGVIEIDRWITVTSNPVEIEILPADVRSASGEKLRELGRGLLMYANDEQGGYPDTLRQLLKGDYIDREDLRWFDENVAYLTKGKTAMDRPGMPLAYDKTLLAKGNGTDVLYNDGHVGFVGAEEFKRIGIAGAEERSEPEPEGTGASEHITLRLIGPDGKAVAAAKVGSMVDWSGTGEAGQGARVYLVGATSALVSGEDGIVVLEAESLFGNRPRGQGVPLYAYQEDSKLGGLIAVSPMYCGEQVELRLQPLCHVKGRLISSDLKELGLALEWTNVYARWQQLRQFRCSSDSQRFEFHLPPGQYKLHAYGMQTYNSEVDLDIKPGQDALDLEIDLPADKLAGLIGKPAPELRQIKGWKNGKATSLADLRGKVVLLDFWGYWCGPCIGQMPKLMELHDAFSEKGLVIIAVHDDSVGSIEQMDARLTKAREKYWGGRDLPFLVALDGGGKIRIEGTDNTTQGATTAAYGITAFPTTVLIDTDGKVVDKVNAYNVEEEIERMLGMAAAAPAWRERFDEVYRLDDGQILRRIAPPFIPERAEYYRHEHSGQAAAIEEPPDFFTFHWDRALVNWGLGFTGGERPLEAVLRHNLSMGRDTFEGPEELLEIDVQGDWIVRKDSSVEQRLEALEKILENEIGREIRFVKRRVEREVIVAGGRYQFRGLPGKGRHGVVYMYSDIFDPDSGGGGGTAESVSEFLAALANRVGAPVIDRTESSENNTIVYDHHRSSRLGRVADKLERAKKLEMLLANLTKQTDLQFKISTEPVEVWFVTEQGGIEAKPPSEVPEGLGYRHVPMTSEEVFGQGAAVVQERLNVREVVERFVAAAVAGEFVQAEKLARAGSAAREQIAELWQIEGGQDIRIVDVYADTAEALAISSIRKGEREKAGILLIHLVNQDAAWLVDGVEHEAKAKAQETLAEFRREHPEAKMIAANVDEPVWGEAVEGVQCRLWPEKRTWKMGQTPKFRVDMRNKGTRELELFLANQRWEIELDGRWYQNRIPWLGDVIRLAFGPGQQHDNLAFPLWESAKLGWRAKYGDEPLEFLPGRHTVRVAFNIRPAEQETWSAVRVVSNPVEMEILMAESETDGGIESAEKLKLLGQAILVYSNDNENKYPESLHQLREDNYIGEADLQWLIENVAYLGKGKNAANLPDVVIAYDRTLLLETHEGTNVLFNDSHVAFSSRDEFERLGIIERAKERLGIIRPAKDRLPSLRGRSTSQVYTVLDRTVDLSHWRPEMSFAEALDSIRNSVEPPLTIVVLWGDLAEKADIDRTTPIYIDGVSAVRLGAALRLLLRAVSAGATELGYVVKDGVIIIATKKSLPKIMETRVYDLYGAEKPVINIETRVVLVSEQLLEDIGLDANSIAQAAVARVPDDRGPRPQWSLGLKQAEPPRPVEFHRRRSDTASAPNAESKLQGFSWVMDEFRVHFLERAIKAHPDSKMLMAPKIAVVDGELATFEIGSEVPYVSGRLKPNVILGRSQPDVDYAETGIKIQVLPKLVADKGLISVDIDFERSEIIGSRPSVAGLATWMYQGTNPDEIPVLETISFATNLSIPTGHTVLIAGQKVKAEDANGRKVDRQFLILIEPEKAAEKDAIASESPQLSR